MYKTFSALGGNIKIISNFTLYGNVSPLNPRGQRTSPVYVRRQVHDRYQLLLSGCGPRNTHSGSHVFAAFFFFPPIILGDYLSFRLLFPKMNGKCFWLFCSGPWPRTLHLVLVKKNQTVDMWSGIRPYWASGPLRATDLLIKRQYHCQGPLKVNYKVRIWQHVEGDTQWNEAEASDFLHLFNVLQLCKANQEQNSTNWTLERLPTSVLASLPQLLACKHLHQLRSKFTQVRQ